MTDAKLAEPAEAEPLPPMAPMTLFVCVTCRDAAHVQSEPSAGSRLHEAIVAAARTDDEAIAIVPVECLSACKRPCAVGFAAPGKWTYVQADLPSATAAATVLAGARLYARAPDGIIPWRQRPDALKKGAVARVPPMTLPLPA